MVSFLESVGRSNIGDQAVKLGEAVRGIRAGRMEEESHEVNLNRTKNLAAEEERQIAKGKERLLISTMRDNLAGMATVPSQKVLDSWMAGAKAQGMISGEGNSAYMLKEDAAAFMSSRLTEANILSDIQIGKMDFDNQVTSATQAIDTYRKKNPNKKQRGFA